MKIYVAGPMRGVPDFNFPAFDMATEHLRELGHTVFSPAERDRNKYGEGVNDSRTGDLADLDMIKFNIRDALGADLAWICAHADAVVVLPGHETSTGARAEVATAKALGIPVYTLAETTGTTSSPRGELLDGAKLLITGDRNNQYGPPTQDFKRTAAMASGFGFMVNGRALEAHHVAIFMILLKMSRLAWTPTKRDSWEDTAGYAGCGYECAVEVETPLQEWERTLLENA